MASTIIIIAAALALVVGGVGFLLFGVLKLPFSLIGSAVAWVVKPIARIFKKGGDAAESRVKSTKAGVEEVGAGFPAAAAA